MRRAIWSLKILGLTADDADDLEFASGRREEAKSGVWNRGVVGMRNDGRKDTITVEKESCLLRFRAKKLPDRIA